MYAYASRQCWRRIYLELKSRGYSMRGISKKIGSDFGRQVYRGNGLRLECFRILKTLVDIPCDIELRNPNYTSKSADEVSIQLDSGIAELVGVILGDGNISERTVMITLNRMDEPEYVEYVKNLISRVIGKTPRTYIRTTSKGIDLKIHSTKLVEFFVNNGLKIGNKVRNQIGIPNWIKQNNELHTKCIKGLLDSDGSIYFRTTGERKKLCLNFRNRSQTLLDDFSDFCLFHNWGVNRRKHIVQMQSEANVRLFIKTVQPFKARKFEEYLHTH